MRQHGYGGGLWLRLAAEDGIALVMAVSFTAVLLLAVTSALGLSLDAQRSSSAGLSRDVAYNLAEAGIADAVAVLDLPSNNALNPSLLPAPPPSTSAQLDTFSTGTVTWGGVLNGSTWTITSIGSARNPAGATGASSNRTLTATVAVHPTLTQPLNNPAWNYVYTTNPPSSGCDETLQNSVTIASPFYVNGNLCLQNTATITSGPLVVRGWLQLQQKGNAVGSPAAPISDAHIVNGCQYQSQPFDNPCQGAVDNVYAQVLDSSSTPVQAPTVYWDAWYQNASPGPYFPCTTASGTPPAFDTTPPDGRNGTYNLAPFNLTPSSSYSCQTAAGQISWDAVGKKLTVSGTIFIDGSAYITNGAVNSYSGQATLYLSGSFLMKNSKLCANLTAGGSSCDTSSWDPNTTLLAIVTGGSGGQVPTGVGAQFVSSYFQGAVYASNSVETDTSSAVDGPICGSSVILGQSVTTSFPTITIVPVGMPSNPTVYAQPDPPILSG